MGMRLERLTIRAYGDQKFSKQVGTDYVVWMNPESYKRTLKVEWTDIKDINAPDAIPTYKRMGAETLSMKLIFDTTGLVPSPLGSSMMPANGVVELLDPLIQMMARVGANKECPNYLQLSWAQLQVKCVLRNMDITYKLFRPDGTPIRAEADLTFDAYSSPLSLGRSTETQSIASPTLVTVSAGETLPSLCEKKYGNSKYYLDVARFNGIFSFRKLKTGTQLSFPPLEQLI